MRQPQGMVLQSRSKPRKFEGKLPVTLQLVLRFPVVLIGLGEYPTHLGTLYLEQVGTTNDAELIRKILEARNGQEIRECSTSHGSTRFIKMQDDSTALFTSGGDRNFLVDDSYGPNDVVRKNPEIFRAYIYLHFLAQHQGVMKAPGPHNWNSSSMWYLATGAKEPMTISLEILPAEWNTNG